MSDSGAGDLHGAFAPMAFFVVDDDAPCAGRIGEETETASAVGAAVLKFGCVGSEHLDGCERHGVCPGIGCSQADGRRGERRCDVEFVSRQRRRGGEQGNQDRDEAYHQIHNSAKLDQGAQPS